MDTAVKSLKAILESGDYDYVEGIPLFDAHDEFDARKFIPDGKGGRIANQNFGKLLHRFDKKRLEEIVSVCNKRIDAGDLSPIGPGHTLPDKGELDQPPVWGWIGGRYSVGEFGPQKKLGILAGFYMKKRIKLPDGREITGREALQEFPRRSIELWHKDSMIDWVALLRRTPERDLGLTVQTYAKDRYAPWGMKSEITLDSSHTRYARACENGGKLRYSMDEVGEEDAETEAKPDASTKPDVKPDDPNQEAPDDPTKEPDSQITPESQPLSPTEEAQAERFWSHYMAKNAWMADACTKYSAAMASPTNTAMPGGSPDPTAEKPEESSDTDNPPGVSQMAKPEEDLLRFQKENEELKTKLAEQQARADRQERVAKYSKALSDLADEGYQFKATEELIDCAEMTQPQFDKHIERIKKNYAKEDRAPIGGEIPVGKLPGDKKDPTEAEMPAVLRFVREKGMTFEEAVTHYRKTN